MGGSIPRNLIPAVEKGVLEACHGPLAGYPVVDVRVRCIDGKYHPVDSNEMAFKIAGSLGFKAAVEKARPTLLEPIMNAEIAVPDEHVGDIMGDISGRRGRVQTSEDAGLDPGHQGAGPHGRNAGVRERPDLPDRGQGRVPHGVLALRGGPRPAAGQGSSRRRRRAGPDRSLRSPRADPGRSPAAPATIAARGVRGA